MCEHALYTIWLSACDTYDEVCVFLTVVVFKVCEDPNHVFFPETEGNFALYCSTSYTFPLKKTRVFFQCACMQHERKLPFTATACSCMEHETLSEIVTDIFEDLSSIFNPRKQRLKSLYHKHPGLTS